MKSLVLSPHQQNKTIPLPSCNFSLPQECCFQKSNWNFLVSTSEIICLINPCLSLRKGDLSWNNPFSSLSFPTFFMPLDAFHFVQLLSAPFHLLDGMLPDSWIINKAVVVKGPHTNLTNSGEVLLTERPKVPQRMVWN